MKKRLHSISFLATLGVMLLSLVCWGGLASAQSSPDAQQPSSQPAQPPDSEQPPAAQQPETPAQSTPQQNAPTQTPDQTAPQSQPPAGQSPSSGAAASADNAGGTQTFTGTIVKQGDKYVFQDASSGTTYDIDHQDEVKKFEGKRVRVHGTMDASGKMIHVQ
ncbi:MAG TPA: DUF5818 domain-containing protein [Candidatus Sulfotelmatobacter sp.]|nr:DUF5818 domain-containing protein [Candidatus Sulfotelmatobacter sp.]